MDNADIYRQFEAAFKNASAYIVLKDGKPVAKVAFKHGNRVTCYFHIMGLRMTKGFANGGGYDRASAAAHVAVKRIAPAAMATNDQNAISTAIQDTGRSWDNDLRHAGFEVVQAI